MVNSTEKNIMTWLEKQGYPLEMSVAKSFQKSGFSVKMGQYYWDKEGSKYREIDIIATTGIFIDSAEKIMFNIHFVIECKLSKSKPWLLFTSNADQDTFKNYEDNLRVANHPAQILLLSLSANESDKKFSLFKIPKPLSYGVTRAHSERVDIPYTAALSCSKAAHSLAKQVDQQWNKESVRSVDLYFPIVVIKGSLFECSLNDDASVNLNEVEQGILLMKNPSAGLYQNIVNFVTSKNIETFSVNAEKHCSELFNTVKKQGSISGFRRYLETK